MSDDNTMISNSAGLTARAVETAIVGTADDMERFRRSAPGPEVGAVVAFDGVVRDHDGGRGVLELEYEGHPSAGHVLRRAADDVLTRHPAVSHLRVAHRIGLLAIGDCALFAEVGTAHRGEAFAACAELVDEIKRVLPVWKRQVFADGNEEWVNSP